MFDWLARAAPARGQPPAAPARPARAGGPAARHEFLQNWAAEQQHQLGPARVPLRIRLARARLSRAGPRRLVQRSATRVLDRGLDTSGPASEPEHHHPERLGYVASPWYV